MTPAVTLTRRLPAAHPSFAGHFPGQPLLPGVVILSEVLEALLGDAAFAAILGPHPVLASARFLAPVMPQGDAPIELVIKVQGQGGGLRFEVTRGDLGVARGQFVAGSAA